MKHAMGIRGYEKGGQVYDGGPVYANKGDYYDRIIRLINRRAIQQVKIRPEGNLDTIPRGGPKEGVEDKTDNSVEQGERNTNKRTDRTGVLVNGIPERSMVGLLGTRHPREKVGDKTGDLRQLEDTLGQLASRRVAKGERESYEDIIRRNIRIATDNSLRDKFIREPSKEARKEIQAWALQEILEAMKNPVGLSMREQECLLQEIENIKAYLNSNRCV